MKISLTFVAPCPGGKTNWPPRHRDRWKRRRKSVPSPEAKKAVKVEMPEASRKGLGIEDKALRRIVKEVVAK